MHLVTEMGELDHSNFYCLIGSQRKFQGNHTVSHSGRNPKIDGREAKTMQDKASATLCLTCKY